MDLKLCVFWLTVVVYAQRSCENLKADNFALMEENKGYRNLFKNLAEDVKSLKEETAL